MLLKILFRKLYIYLNSRVAFTKLKFSKEIDIINKFKIYSDFDRSRLQFYSQSRTKNILNVVLLEGLSLLIIFPLILSLFIHGIFKIYLTKTVRRKVNIFFKNNISKRFVPCYLWNDYIIQPTSNTKYGYLFGLKDLKFILVNFRFFPFSVFFIVKCIIKLANYHFIIYKYSPSEIVCTDESSFMSSLLTIFCNQNNIKHTCIMHGEKILDITDSFFYFNEMCCWDIHYQNMFEILRCKLDKIVIDIPHILIQEREYVEVNSDYKIYLQGQNESELLKLKNNLNKMGEKKVLIREHPIFNTKLSKRILSDFKFESSVEIDIIESITTSDFVVSQFSTVLFYANYLNKKVVIDDISNQNLIEELKLRDYIGFKFEHILLSNL
jgi:hypothetical protein